MLSRSLLARSFHAAVAAAAALAFSAGACTSATVLSEPSSIGPADAATQADGANGGGSGSSDASACRPASVETYKPDAYRSATGAYQGACKSESNVDLVELFFGSCLGQNASKQACATYVKDYPQCAACIVTPDTSAHYGPIVARQGFVTGNLAGCIELTDPVGLSCAKALQALDGCERAACAANCPVTSQASLDAYGECAGQANQGGCQSYEQAASCADGEREGGTLAASVCFRGPSFKDFYDSVVPLFCGPPPSAPHADAGASPDAPND